MANDHSRVILMTAVCGKLSPEGLLELDMCGSSQKSQDPFDNYYNIFRSLKRTCTWYSLKRLKCQNVQAKFILLKVSYIACTRSTTGSNANKHEKSQGTHHCYSCTMNARHRSISHVRNFKSRTLSQRQQ